MATALNGVAEMLDSGQIDSNMNDILFSDSRISPNIKWIIKPPLHTETGLEDLPPKEEPDSVDEEEDGK